MKAGLPQTADSGLSKGARQSDRPEDYARLKLERRLIKPWEDGIRIDTAAPDLEWWYIDADLDDGTGLCMIFATKDGTRPHQPLGPQLEIDVTLPDGTRMVRSWYPRIEEFSASKDGCDVRMGDCRRSTGRCWRATARSSPTTAPR